MLHGAENYYIDGTISKDIQGNTTYKFTYTWMDTMDPNYAQGDESWERLARRLTGDRAKDFAVQIMWADSSTIKVNGDSSGWLSSWSSDWQIELNPFLVQMMRQSEDWDSILRDIKHEHRRYYECEE